MKAFQSEGTLIMSDEDLQRKAHDLDVTVWVGKGGVESVVDELADQLDDRDLVKVKFLRAARGGTSTEELAEDLADRVDAELLRTRGHTAVMH
ncbi:YhbY family RNA-binding protein [Natronoarchaeum mannanilyticum]|uniref:YhbY family RNA-binding protein n=2 Tax=Natronoarchaeum mannanilyticum TaxID=926360 RepID=A0AAV3TEU8_9EURY